MYLENIYSPADVKKLSFQELNDLSNEIRASLLQKLSEHGGHFGPNFGMVEATIYIMYSIHRKTRLFLMYRIKVMCIRC